MARRDRMALPSRISVLRFFMLILSPLILFIIEWLETCRFSNFDCCMAQSDTGSLSPENSTSPSLPPPYPETQTPSETSLFLQKQDMEALGQPPILEAIKIDASVEKKPDSHFKLVRTAWNLHDCLKTYQNEQQKEAASSRRLSALQDFALFHLLAVLVTVSLMILYVKQLRWTPSAEQLSALQFAAKAHESLIIISLTDILFHRSRRKGWYPARFWGTVLNPTTTRRRFHAITAGGIILLAMIGIGAGPFSAIAMIPRLTWWEVAADTIPHYESIYYISEQRYQTELDPDSGYRAAKKFCKDQESPEDCENDVFDSLFDDMKAVLFNPPRIPRTKNILFTSYGNASQHRPITLSVSDSDYALATGPLAFVAEALYRDATYSDSNGGLMVQSMPRRSSQRRPTTKWEQPAVTAMCANTISPINLTAPTVSFRFDNDGGEGTFNVTLDMKGDLRSLRELYKEYKIGYDASIIFPENTTANYDLGGSRNRTHIQLCLVRGRWISADTWVTPQVSSIVQPDFGVPNQDILKKLYQTSTAENTIKMTREWLTGSPETYSSTSEELSVYGDSLLTVLKRSPTTLELAYHSFSLSI
ncbi:hypothetical protein B0T10DRAFT_560054 [Thelonectria olida]|uniref:Uncharacterized protein n=1 Tax=Thelonectria olida TaxID=1576542 RepID=A0A9P9ANV2_9HYPO|nr:hypothetical protein B0T10DRAFT_560054 [Thelonectria olida]